MLVIRAAVACLVLLGPLAWLRRRRVLDPGWHPLLVLSTWSVVCLLAGMAGHLRLGVGAVVAVGLLTLLRELLVDRAGVVATLRAPSTLALGGTAALLVLLVHGQVVTHYDNFSHWALVVAVMLENDALPGPADDVVTFTTYPLGAASLLYLGHVLLGEGEPVSMLVHQLFTATCLLPVVTAAGRRWWWGVGLYALGVLALVTAITSPTSLLVDSLVAGLAGALLLLVLLHRDALVRSPWALAAVGAALVAAKTSGLLFLAVATIVGLLVLLARPASWRRRLVRVGWLAVPWLVWWLWGRYVELTFPEAEDAKHSASMGRLAEVRGEKSPEDVRHILDQLLAGTLGSPVLWGVLVVFVLTVVLAARAGSLTPREARWLLGVVPGTVVLWEASLALMYLWSMPLGEALALAGLSRYQGTVYLVVMVVTLGVAARWCAHVSRLGAAPVVGLLVAATLPLGLARPDHLLKERGSDPRASVERTLAGVEVRPDDTVCVLLERTDAGYRSWMVRYLLGHRDVRNIVLADDDTELPERAGPCDGVLLLDGRDRTRQLLRDDGWPVPPDPAPRWVVRP